ncbi:MAG: hypothetical protein HFJ18_00350 [Clostridia bacterium]|nr:hypothetical protein [Clostridia bacterium]
MNKKILTMIFIFILAIMLFANFSNVQASRLSDAFSAGEKFTENGKSNIINYQNLYNVVNYLYNIAMLIAIIIAIIIGIVLGIRIVFGSIDERADSKHLMVPYLASVATAAFAFTIWKVMLQIIHNHI